MQTVVGREQSNLIDNKTWEGRRATWHTTVQTTSVERKQSNLTYNISHCDINHYWKGTKRPDRQYYLLLHRLLLEGSKQPDKQHHLLSHRLLWKGSIVDWLQYTLNVRIANSWARIKPTASLSALDKENSIEFPLDLLYYIYNYYHGYAPCFPQSSCPSADFFVTCCDYDCDFIVMWPFCDFCHTFVSLWLVTWYFLCSTLVIIEKKRKEKEKK